MNANADPDFAPIATRIRDNVGRQGFMTHVGAELAELTRGTCTLVVDRRPELLQQNGLFHGGVTAFLVDNATTIAASDIAGAAGADGGIQIEFAVAGDGRAADLPRA